MSTSSIRETNQESVHEEVARLADFMMFAQRSFLLDLSKELQHDNVSFAQFFLLGYLAKEDFLTITDVARKMGHSTAAATGLIDRLEHLGYLQRLTASDDRKKVFVEITSKGLELVASKREDIVKSLTDLMENMSAEDRRSMLEAHGKLTEGGETDLLAAITAGPTKEFWSTYRALKQKAELSELSDEEASQLVSMATEIEAADADRLSSAAQLAKLRGVPFDDLVKQFEIGIEAP